MHRCFQRIEGKLYYFDDQYVPVTGGYTPHCWSVVCQDGAWYVYDVELQKFADTLEEKCYKIPADESRFHKNATLTALYSEQSAPVALIRQVSYICPKTFVKQGLSGILHSDILPVTRIAEPNHSRGFSCFFHNTCCAKQALMLQ